jgi:hypothetical protein
VFDWPADGRLAVPELPDRATKAYLLGDADKRPLELTAGSGGDADLLAVPTAAPDPIDSVIVVECK